MVAEFGLKHATAMFILGVMTLFLIVIHLGFASATALASAMIPIVIAVLQGVDTPGINVVGMTMLLQFVVSFGFILVVNAPQNMVAYGTETFAARDFVRTGLVLTLIASGPGHAARRYLLALARLHVSSKKTAPATTARAGLLCERPVNQMDQMIRSAALPPARIAPVKPPLPAYDEAR